MSNTLDVQVYDNKCVAIVSGGMDSTVLAYQCNFAYKQLIMVSFNYGQRHKKELDYAAKTAAALGADHRIIDMGFMAALLGGSALTSPDVAVPDGHYAEESMRQTVVPNRNMIMLSIACGIAVAEKADALLTGVHAGDHFIYPDCRPEFIRVMNNAMKIANLGFIPEHFELHAPYSTITKADIARVGDAYKVPWQDTWSCYKGGAMHCGVCGTCTERREAFEIAGIDDPTRYADLTKHWQEVK